MKAKETEQAKKGTFQLKRQELMLPFGDGKSFLTKDSSDEEAIAFINFKNGKYKEHREKNLFDKLPDALLGKKKSAPKQDAPKKPAVKTKKVAAKPQNKG